MSLALVGERRERRSSSLDRKARASFPMF